MRKPNSKWNIRQRCCYLQEAIIAHLGQAASKALCTHSLLRFFLKIDRMAVDVLAVLRSIPLTFHPSVGNISKVLGVLLITYVLYWLSYGVFLSKTRNIPGPLLNRFSFLPLTSLWLSWHFSRKVNDLHKKYGPPPLSTLKLQSDYRPYHPPCAGLGICFRNGVYTKDIRDGYVGTRSSVPKSSGGRIHGREHCFRVNAGRIEASEVDVCAFWEEISP